MELGGAKVKRHLLSRLPQGIGLLGIIVLALALPKGVHALPPGDAFLGSPYYGSSYIFTNYCFQPPHNGYDYGLYYAPVLAAADGTLV